MMSPIEVATTREAAKASLERCKALPPDRFAELPVSQVTDVLATLLCALDTIDALRAPPRGVVLPEEDL